MKFTYSVLLILCFITLNLTAEEISDRHAPEVGLSIAAKHSPKLNAIVANEFIVASAHPLATQAAYDILNKGGNAIDAMVTVQTVLGLVEPQSSGLGGGAFLVYYDAKKKQIRTFDGRETAPLEAQGELFLDENKDPIAFFDAVVGGRSVGTPGTVKLLSELHSKLGNLNWKELLQPSATLAEQGFTVGARLANAVKRDKKHLKSDITTYNYFFPNNTAIKQGQHLKNPEYANTIRQLSQNGGDYFYNSEISQAIIEKVKQAKKPGLLSQNDFENYKVIERLPVCSNYQSFDVCGMGPPSSGALSVSQTLGILESFNLSSRSPSSADTWQLIADASRLAFADRGLYIADNDFVKMPNGLLDKNYLRSRATLLSPGKALSKASPGVPDPSFALTTQTGNSLDIPSTSHFVIVDKDKNIVSMTSTIENGFGSRLMVKGFLLNNELTDFSFRPKKDGKLVANRVEPGKRPRSSMAPTIVLKDNEPYLALGSPGGSRIINYVTNSLIAILDWNKTPQEAFDLPHIINRFGTMDIEEGTSAENFDKAFKDMGYKTSIRNLNSGLHGVLFTEKGIIGGADKRREGIIMGR